MKCIALLALVFVQALPAADKVDTKDDRAQAWALLDESLQGNSEHRQQALAALSTIGFSDEGAVQRAVTALHDKDLFVRRSAALALGDLKAVSALGSLKAALDDSPEVSFAAAKALTQLGDTSVAAMF